MVKGRRSFSLRFSVRNKVVPLLRSERLLMIETAVGEVNQESNTDAKEIANSLTHADITLGPDPLTRSEKGLKAAFHYVKRDQHLRKREG